MKRLLCLCFLVVLLLGCRQPKELVYEGVRNFGIRPSDAKQTVITIDVALYNPNRYDLKLKGADIDVFLNGTHVGKMNATDKAVLSALNTTTLPVVLDVELRNILPNMIQLALSKEVSIKLSGSIRAGRHGVFIKLPVNYEGKQAIPEGLLKI